MGIHYRFTCPACGYSTEASGGDDFGFVAETTTIVCEDCRELQDVLIANLDCGTRQKTTGLTLQCRKDKTHKVRKWKYPDSCPKCGGAMVRGEVVLMWD